MTKPLNRLDEAVVNEAVTWLSHFWSGEVSEASTAEWRQWRAADPSHERAWQQIEAMDSRWAQGTKNLTAATALRALSAPDTGRRRALKALSLMTVFAGSGWLVQRQLPWPAWIADARTETGERHTMTLADSSKVTLNTNSAIDLAFNNTERRVELVRGEIFVATAADRDIRPFFIQTSLGNVCTLGAEFLLHQRKEDVLVSVLKGSALVHPKHFPEKPFKLGAGQSVTFAEDHITNIQTIGNQAAWLEGALVASNTPLAEFLTDLSRYCLGHISCDPALSDLRLSGTFPLTQKRQILIALTQVLPVQLQTFGPWVTRLVPAETTSA